MDSFVQQGEFRLTYTPPGGGKGWEALIPNGPTVEGINYLLEAGFRGRSLVNPWYIGVIDNAGFSALSSADASGSHPGWNEYTAVASGNRPQWVPAGAVGGQLVSSVSATVSITADGSVRGAFLASRQPTGLNSAGVLYATAAMNAGLAVSAGGTLTITYSTRLRPVS